MLGRNFGMNLLKRAAIAALIACNFTLFYLGGLGGNADLLIIYCVPIAAIAAYAKWQQLKQSRR